MCEKSKERERREVGRMGERGKECEGIEGAHIRRAVAARAAG